MNDGMNNDSTIQINWYLPLIRLNPVTEPKPNLRVDLRRVNSEKEPHQTHLGKRISDTR